jgi:exodeoxyribonuclease VII large subunit
MKLHATHATTDSASGQPAARIYQVSELNREVRAALESGFGSLWVEGEISNFKLHSSGHMYLSLKDEKSQIGCVFFGRHNQSLRFEPADGLKVVVYGRISVYEPRGQYQIYIERMQPKGMGELQLAFLQLKERLGKEGLFDEARKRAIPKFPAVVGVVTSPTGAAIRDILNVVGRRFRGTEVVLCPARVQGEGAAREIAEGIRMLNRLGGVDVLIVGRGGGSLEDLWAFNEEMVARAVFESKIPVISAVGHEIDWTICDLVADLRAPTPSAAAELVVENRENVEARIAECRERMTLAVRNLVAARRSELETLASSYALRQPAHLVQQYSQRLDELMRQLGNYFRTVLAAKGHALRHAAGRLNALSPLAILERGYSLTLAQDGKPVRSARDLKAGATVTTRLWKGGFESQVVSIDRGEE